MWLLNLVSTPFAIFLYHLKRNTVCFQSIPPTPLKQLSFIISQCVGGWGERGRILSIITHSDYEVKKKKKKPSQRILQLLHFNNLWFSRCHFKTIFSCQVICFFCFVFLNFLFKKMEKKMFRSHKCFNLF